MTLITYDSTDVELKAAGIPERGYLRIIEEEVGQPVEVIIIDDTIGCIHPQDIGKQIFVYMIGHFGRAFKQWWEARHGSECPF